MGAEHSKEAEDCRSIAEDEEEARHLLRIIESDQVTDVFDMTELTESEAALTEIEDEWKNKYGQYIDIDVNNNDISQMDFSMEEIDPETRSYLDKLPDISVIQYKYHCERPNFEKKIPLDLEATTVNGVPIKTTEVFNAFREIQDQRSQSPTPLHERFTDQDPVTEEMMNDLRARGLTVIRFDC